MGTQKDRKVYRKIIEIMERMLEYCPFEFIQINIKCFLAITHHVANLNGNGSEIGLQLIHECIEKHYGCLPLVLKSLVGITTERKPLEEHFSLYQRVRECIQSGNFDRRMDLDGI